jgi:hypothetical protein
MSARPQRRSLNLSALKVELSAAIKYASSVCADPDVSHELRLRAVSALATAASVYSKLWHDTVVDERLTALEARLAQPEVSPNGRY